MSDVVSKYIEICTSIFIFVVSASFVLSLMVVCSTPIINLDSDKTMIESDGVQQHYVADMYGYDILAMLINTDPMSPYPKAIRINNSPVLKLDNAFLAYKMRNVSVVYQHGGSYGLSDMLDWKVTSRTFVYDAPDAPYIQYKLEEGA